MLGLILASEHLERIIDRGPSAQEDGTLCFLGTHSDFARFLHFHRLFPVSPRLIATMRLFVF